MQNNQSSSTYSDGNRNFSQISPTEISFLNRNTNVSMNGKDSFSISIKKTQTYTSMIGSPDKIVVTTANVFSASMDGVTGRGYINVHGDILLGGSLITPSKSFPDFVFSQNYNLRTLSSTKEYIATNGHLPDVPSAQEVESNGLDLVKMNQILLQKVEELTLHAIRQQEQIDALNVKLDHESNNNPR